MNSRETACRKLINPHFLGVVSFITFNYLVFVLLFMLEKQPTGYLVMLVVFHVLFFMLLWSHVRTIFSDPGRVPIYWGFFAEETENKRRRYCLLCHSFKPERCHHCSTCQRCVLNMDHHCPWIINCVGFNNRKFFMLFLFYIILSILFCIVCEIPVVIQEVQTLIQNVSLLDWKTIVRAIGFIIQVSFFFVILVFFKYHVDLVFTNSSTIDSLERNRHPGAGPNIYNVGTYSNFTQVFGPSACLWLLPISPPPNNNANGVMWPKNNL